jgi:hypothetical protein
MNWIKRLFTKKPTWTADDIMPPTVWPKTNGFNSRTFCLTSEGLYVTDDFLADSVEWQIAAQPQPGQSFYDFTIDKARPSTCALLWATDGLYWSENLETWERIKEF